MRIGIQADDYVETASTSSSLHEDSPSAKITANGVPHRLQVISCRRESWGLWRSPNEPIGERSDPRGLQPWRSSIDHEGVAVASVILPPFHVMPKPIVISNANRAVGKAPWSRYIEPQERVSSLPTNLTRPIEHRQTRPRLRRTTRRSTSKSSGVAVRRK